MADSDPDRPKVLQTYGGVQEKPAPASMGVPRTVSAGESLDCADNFTFRLVKRGNKYYFQDVKVTPPLANHEEAALVQRWLEGRALDEINTEEFAEAFSGAGRCSGLQTVIAHLKEMFSD
ncbi:MAG: hypothetical protein N3A38_08100 [Planctomycetota bacterium]|nr:hypothetical protein [Planctomycetota bacterium]